MRLYPITYFGAVPTALQQYACFSLFCLGIGALFFGLNVCRERQYPSLIFFSDQGIMRKHLQEAIDWEREILLQGKGWTSKQRTENLKEENVKQLKILNKFFKLRCDTGMPF